MTFPITGRPRSPSTNRTSTSRIFPIPYSSLLSFVLPMQQFPFSSSSMTRRNQSVVFLGVHNFRTGDSSWGFHWRYLIVNDDRRISYANRFVNVVIVPVMEDLLYATIKVVLKIGIINHVQIILEIIYSILSNNKSCSCIIFCLLQTLHILIRFKYILGST